MNELEEDRLYQQLIRLGDMMGDGLHYEKDGKWIEKEYRKVARALGLIPKKSTTSIDEYMKKHTIDVKCNCGGLLKQTRKGSYVGKCVVCGNKYRLGKKMKRSK